MWPLFVRWAVIGVASYVGSKVAQQLWESADKDGWISKGAQDTLEDLRHTWTGRQSTKDTDK
jgi:hypothetical protein